MLPGKFSEITATCSLSPTWQKKGSSVSQREKGHSTWSNVLVYFFTWKNLKSEGFCIYLAFLHSLNTQPCKCIKMWALPRLQQDLKRLDVKTCIIRQKAQSFALLLLVKCHWTPWMQQSLQCRITGLPWTPRGSHGIWHPSMPMSKFSKMSPHHIFHLYKQNTKLCLELSTCTAAGSGVESTSPYSCSWKQQCSVAKGKYFTAPRSSAGSLKPWLISWLNQRSSVSRQN